MKRNTVSVIRLCSLTTLVVAAWLFAPVGSPQSGSPAVTIISPSKQAPVQTNLVSDIPGLGPITIDPNLINPWGIANSAASPYWISDQGTGKSTLYNGAGTQTNLIVTVPPVGSPSGPTGIVSVPSTVTGFDVPGTTTTAHFIFDTLAGTIAAWASGGTATTAATITGAVFTGLALANNGTANYLYAANFVSGGTIDVFDSSFHSTTLSGSFTDPGLPAGYAPFNIELIGTTTLYVAYAKVGGSPGAPAGGAGAGLIDTFDTNGNFLKELISAGPLNAPWGMALAPSGFAAFPGALLIGNFGNGQINAFSASSGAFIGTLSDPDDRPIVNEGLWAIEFGNQNNGSSATTLYFTAGINGEQDGLFGAISPGPVTLTFAGQLVGTASTAQSITVENTGSAALNITAAPALSGASASDFAIAGTGTTCTNGASVAVGASCTVAITFTPSAAGARGPVTLTITDNASPTTQIVNVSGTGTTAAPAVTIAPTTPLTFAAQTVSSTSTAQTVTITNSGNAPLTFGAQAIAVSSDFGQTNTCNGVTVAVGGTCTISVTFSPSSATNNPRTGTLTITDNALNSPQTVSLSGTAMDFTLSVPSTASVNKGSNGTVTVTIGALGGFTGSVALTCTGSIIQGTCTVSPASVTAPGTATATLTTTAASLQTPVATRRSPPITLYQLVLSALAIMLALVLPLMHHRRTRLSLAAATVALLVVVGCSSSTPTTTTTTNTGTPSGQYIVALSATSGGVTHTTNVTLTVN